MPMIEIETSDGATIGAYQALPASGPPQGGIVVIQEIFGVNAHIRAIADRLAEAGFAALAPALFDRTETGVELAYDEAGTARGSTLARGIPMEQHILSAEAAIAALAPAGKVGIVGFCLGGTIAFATATRTAGLAAAVGYYGGAIATMLGATPRCPLELHFGEADAHIPMTDVAAIKDACPDVPVYTYPGAGHGFNCDQRGSYHKASADIAWARTLEMFRLHL